MARREETIARDRRNASNRSVSHSGSLRMSNRSWRSESSVVSAVGGVKRVTAQSPVLIPVKTLRIPGPRSRVPFAISQNRQQASVPSKDLPIR